MAGHILPPTGGLPVGGPQGTDLPPAQLARIWQAAKNFEAMAIGQLLQPMFDTIDTAHDPFGGGQAEAAWQPMLVDELGKQIAGGGGFGLAQPVFAAMLRAQEAGEGTTRRVAADTSATGKGNKR
jgi:flagellar protein FlgJ